MKIQQLIVTALVLIPTLALAQETPTDPAAEATAETTETATEAAVETTTETPAEVAPETSADTPADTTTETPVAETPAETPPTETPAASTTEAPATETPETPPAETVTAPAGDGVTATLTVGDSSTIERSGLYFGFGLAWALSNLADEGMDAKSGDFWLRMGWAINSQILVGGEFALVGNFIAWEESEVAGAMMSSVMATGMYFPMPDIPLSVSAGLGWGSNLYVQRLADSSGDNPLASGASDNGLSFMAAVGYDFGAGPGANFGVRLRWDGAVLGDRGMANNIGLGVALNFY